MQDHTRGLPSSPCDVEASRIHDWLVEPALNRLRHQASAVQVEPRIMHVLVCLASRPGKVISRDALLEVVWGKVVVNEEALTQAISQLRRVFEDDARSPRFIQTIPKTGYRLVAPVTTPESLVEPEVPPPPADAPVCEIEPAGRRVWREVWRPRRRLGLVVGVLVLAIAAVSVTASLLRSGSSGSVRGIPLEETPFTTYPGQEIHPAMSPDGTRIAFVWKQEGGGYDLYVKQRNTETPLRLTETGGGEYFPAWSPDGSDIAYALAGSEPSAIYIVPAIGGVPRKVIDTPYGIAGIDWSPDGRLLAAACRPDDASPLSVWLIDLATGERRVVTAPDPLSSGDIRPTFSPDGRRLAFIRGDRTHLQDIFIVPVDGGDPERLTSSQHSVLGLDWAPDGKSLVFASAPNSIADARLWRLTLENGALAWLPTANHRPARPSIACRGRGLVYEEATVKAGIYVIHVDGPAGEPEAFISSTRNDYGAQYSPAGNLVSFISDRSGSPQIWICDRDGASARQVTRFDRAHIEYPYWSYDQRRLAFTAAPGSRAGIYVADVATGEVKCLSASAAHEKCLGWSRDGDWIYLKSEQDHTWRIRKMRAGGGEVVDLMDRDVFRLAESTDGRRVIYSRADTSGVWAASTAGTGEVCLVDQPDRVVPCGWRETGRGIYFFSFRDGVISLWLLDASTAERSLLASGANMVGVNIDVSPSGDAVIFDRLEPKGSDLAIVESF